MDNSTFFCLYEAFKNHFDPFPHKFNTNTFELVMLKNVINAIRHELEDKTYVLFYFSQALLVICRLIFDNFDSKLLIILLCMTFEDLTKSSLSKKIIDNIGTMI